LFIAVPEYLDDLNRIERAYPGGRNLEVHGAGERFLFRAYELPA
jgi:hypothetical protein